MRDLGKISEGDEGDEGMQEGRRRLFQVLGRGVVVGFGSMMVGKVIRTLRNMDPGRKYDGTQGMKDGGFMCRTGPSRKIIL